MFYHDCITNHPAVIGVIVIGVSDFIGFVAPDEKKE